MRYLKNWFLFLEKEEDISLVKSKENLDNLKKSIDEYKKLIPEIDLAYKKGDQAKIKSIADKNNEFINRYLQVSDLKKDIDNHKKDIESKNLIRIQSSNIMNGASGEMKLNYEKEIKKLSDTILNNKSKITEKEKKINIIISELDSQIAEREKQIIEDIKKISDNQSEENL
jgi:hypothetical protein